MSDQQTQQGMREFISLVDVGQFEEEALIEGYQGAKDANAQRVPLPHDNYVMRVRYADNWPSKEGETPIPLASDPNARWIKSIAKDGKELRQTWIYVETANNADEAVNGMGWTELITTYPTKQGTTAAQALLQGLEVDTLMLNTHGKQVQALDEKLAGDGSLVGAEIDWIARVFDKAATVKDKAGNPVQNPDGSLKTGVEVFRLRGMRKFPMEADGKTHRFTLTHEDNVNIPETTAEGQPLEVRAFNEVRRWIPVSKLMSAGQGQDAVAETAPADTPSATPAAPAPVAQPRQAVAAQATAPAQAAAPRPAAAPARPVVRRVPGAPASQTR